METEVVSELMEHLSDKKLEAALKVNTTVRAAMGEFLRDRGFIEIPPVIFSTVTDPLNHPVYDPSFEYEGTRYALTKSMIFHKQIIVQKFPKIFTFSPNIRLEMPEKARTGRHLLEFTQLDLEVKGATREDLIKLGEELFIHTLEKVIEKHSQDLHDLGRSLSVPHAPFKRYKFEDAVKKYGSEFETILSKEAREPFWIVDIPLKEREFYDRESDVSPGILNDMDLIYPEGYCEALSGGEREFDLDRIMERIRRKGQTYEQFKWFLEFARGGLELSTGFGIGIERLVRYICGFERIEDVHPFPKVPGKVSV
jgi:asparaginyl-tRNA synthetase